jgi:hypothetical protein
MHAEWPNRLFVTSMTLISVVDVTLVTTSALDSPKPLRPYSMAPLYGLSPTIHAANLLQFTARREFTPRNLRLDRAR